MANHTTAIQASNLSKAFGGRTVLRRLDLDVTRAEQIALTGANGAGKTTLLRCLASVLRPTSGEVRWFGRPAAANPAARRLIAMVGHETRLYPHLTVRENLLFAARMYGVAQPGRRADHLLDQIGLRPHAHRFPVRISRGMRQRVAIVRALVHDPLILLLDEPFSGLDQQATGWLVDLLRKLRARGSTVCFTTHDRQKAEQLADRVLHLCCGRAEEVGVRARTVFGDIPPKARAA
jgi:heme ABC exporter ATP-binding subunit CcmA